MATRLQLSLILVHATITSTKRPMGLFLVNQSLVSRFLQFQKLEFFFDFFNNFCGILTNR